MLAHKKSAIFGQLASVAAMGFLLWTLSSTTFLDVKVSGL